MNIRRDSEEYKRNFSFVPSYGEDVLSLITARKGERALDLGCGNGHLTSALGKRGFSVLLNRCQIVLAPITCVYIIYNLSDS